MKDLVKDPHTNLYVMMPQGNGRTILKEVLLAADHNPYHIVEFAIMRQTMGTWGRVK